jgi:hypothetical protein
MSKRGYYLGGHGCEYGSPRMGHLSESPFAYLTRKPQKPKRSRPDPLLGRDAEDRYAQSLLRQGRPLTGHLKKLVEKYIRRSS